MKKLFFLSLIIFCYCGTGWCDQFETRDQSFTQSEYLLAANDTGISQDVDTVSHVIKDAVKTAPEKGSPLNQWWVWVSGLVLAGFGLVTYFKKKYGKKKQT